MNVQELFIRTLDDLRSKISSLDSYECLRGAALLRQLLLDKRPLIHLALARQKIHIDQLQFVIIDYHPAPIAYEAEFYELPLSPELSRPLPLKSVNFSEFLKCGVFLIRGKTISIREAIKYLCHAEGGIHSDPRGTQSDLGLTDDEMSNLTALQNQLKIGGVESISKQVIKIGRVVINALQSSKAASTAAQTLN